MLLHLLAYRDLIWMLTLRDIRIRYKQAVMGFIWAIFMPVVAVGAGILIKKAMAVVAQQEVDMLEVVSISVKVVPWTFFISGLQFAVQSLVGNATLVTKIYFPKAVLPLAAVNACLFDFLVAMGVLVVLLGVFHLPISVHVVWFPFLIVCIYLFTAGAGMILAAANLFYRDVKYIVQVILRFGIFFTPVLYSTDKLGNWEWIAWINPVGSLLECLDRTVVRQSAPPLEWLFYGAVWSVAVFFAGLKLYQMKEHEFAENI